MIWCHLVQVFGREYLALKADDDVTTSLQISGRAWLMPTC